MWSYSERGVTPNPVTRVLLREWQMEIQVTETHRGECHVKKETKTMVMCPQAKESHQQLEERHGMILSLQNRPCSLTPCFLNSVL